VTVFIDEEPFVAPGKALYDLTTDENSYVRAKDRACVLDLEKI
jgi:hypothetical protein